MVYLYRSDDENTVIDSVVSSPEGTFTFSSLSIGEYVVLTEYNSSHGAIKREQ